MPPSPQLFDDSALPSWLSAAASAPLAGPGAAPQPLAGTTAWSQGAGAPSGSPFEVPGGTYGLPGQSLLDTSALPQWLGGPAGEREHAAPEPALGGDGMRAHALVDERSLPLWLRQEPSVSADAPAPGAVSQWLASPATDEPLPTWLNQVYAAAQVPRVPVPNPVAAPWETPNAGAPPSLGTMAGSQLLDDTALPEWLQAAGAPGASSAFPAPAPFPTQGQPQPAGPSGPFAAPIGGAGDASIGIPSGSQPFAFGGVVPLVSPSESRDWSSGSLAGPASPAGSQPSGGLSRGFPGFLGQSGSPAGPAASPLSASMASPGGSGTLASGAFPATPDAAGEGGGERFSASDLIDPDVLPEWVHQQGPAAEPVFSSTQGWTSKQPAASPGYSAPATFGQLPNAGGWAEARGAAAAAPLDETNLPPWLRHDQPPAVYAPDGAGEMYSGGRGRAGVPQSELPPWLRSGNGGGGEYPNGGPYEADGGGEQWGWGANAQAAGWGADARGYAAQPPSPDYAAGWNDQAAGGAESVTHYADRFRDEVPGAQRPFGYEYDHSSLTEDYQPGAPGGAGQPAWDDQPPRSHRRRRWFGRN